MIICVSACAVLCWCATKTRLRWRFIKVISQQKKTGDFQNANRITKRINLYTSLSLARSADKKRFVRQRPEIDKVYTVRWLHGCSDSVCSGDSLPVSSSCVISLDLRCSTTSSRRGTAWACSCEEEGRESGWKFLSVRTNIRLRSRRRRLVQSELLMPDYKKRQSTVITNWVLHAIEYLLPTIPFPPYCNIHEHSKYAVGDYSCHASHHRLCLI